MKRYHLNYLACVISMLAALICAMGHSLGWMLVNFFLAVYNWYIAEWLREKEAKHEENDNRDSDDSDSSSSTEDDTEDKE